MHELTNEKIYELVDLMRHTDEIFQYMQSWEDFWKAIGMGYLKLSYLTWSRIYKELGIDTVKMNDLPVFESMDEVLSNESMWHDDWTEMIYDKSEFHEPDIDHYKNAGIEVEVFSFDYEAIDGIDDIVESEDREQSEYKNVIKEFAESFYADMYLALPEETTSFLDTTARNNFGYSYTMYLKSKRIGNYITLKNQNMKLFQDNVCMECIDFLIESVFNPLYIRYEHANFNRVKNGIMYSFFAYGYVEGTEEQVEPLHSKMYRELAVILLDKLLSQVESEYQEIFNKLEIA